MHNVYIFKKSNCFLYNTMLGIEGQQNKTLQILYCLFVPLLKATVTSVLEYLISWFGEKKFTPELVIFNSF